MWTQSKPFSTLVSRPAAENPVMKRTDIPSSYEKEVTSNYLKELGNGKQCIILLTKLICRDANK